MTSAPLTAESYHLKWDSHLMHLNLSIATLYKHDRFADVMLLSSHPDCLGGPGVPAHKVILSTSSKFFANIFELTPHIPSQNGLMYLVLPPELSRRAIQVLVQYMYSGESTVSNDILNEVLSGGELLKIRGLYRGNTGGLNKNLNLTSPIVNANISTNSNHSIIQNSSCSPSLNLKNISNIKPSSKVLVQHIKPFPLSVIPDKQFGLSIKKDIAIDPDPRKNLNLSPTSNNLHCTISSQNTIPQSLLSVSTDSHTQPQEMIEKRKSSIGSNYSDCLLQIKEEPNDSCSEKSQPISFNFNKTDTTDSKIIDTEYESTENSFIEDASGNEIVLENCDIKVQNPLSSESEDNSTSIFSDDHFEEKIFLEKLISKDNTRDTGKESKQDSMNYVPKKKRKMETESITDKKKPIQNNSNKLEEISVLKCDICHIVFKSPADWVRHMQQIHTETELAISNEKLKEVRSGVGWNNVTKEYMEKLTKVCNYCKKSFSTYKEMIAHVKRNHPRKK